MRSYIKALIFDLDGTLADTIPAITEAINMTMSALSLPSHTEQEVRGYINRGPRHLISEAIPQEVRDRDPEIVDKALAIYNKNYAKTYMHTDKLYDGLEEIILELSKYYNCEFDDRGNIGKRYRRQDEIGTPFCVTYDFESENDGMVTVRFRDSMEQERVAIADLDAYFADKFTF